jgi:hypothetical protein
VPAPDRPVIDRLSGAASALDGQADRPAGRLSPHRLQDALSRGRSAGVQLVGQRYRAFSEQTARYPAIRTADEACSGYRFPPGCDGGLKAGQPDMDVLHRDLPHPPTRSAASASSAVRPSPGEPAWPSTQDRAD